LHYLSVDETDLLNPLLLDNMKEGAMLLTKHISMNNDAILIIDADCDGYCSGAIFLNYFNRLFPAWV